MNTTDAAIQGLLGGLLFALLGLGIGAIIKVINRVINKKKKEKEEIANELKLDFQEPMSIEAKTAIRILLNRIVRYGDENITQKQYSVISIIFLILKLNNESVETLNYQRKKLEKLSNDELLEYLSGFDWTFKEWFVKAVIYLLEPITQQRNNYIQPIFLKLGITTEQYNEIKNRICQRNDEIKSMYHGKGAKRKLQLNHSEIIILSIVIGVFTALILGYVFPQHYYITDGIKVYRENYNNHSEFNYLLAFSSLIIVSGISYLCLMRKTKREIK